LRTERVPFIIQGQVRPLQATREGRSNSTGKKKVGEFEKEGGKTVRGR